MISAKAKIILKIFILLFFPPGGRFRLLGSFVVTNIIKIYLLVQLYT